MSKTKKKWLDIVKHNGMQMTHCNLKLNITRIIKVKIINVLKNKSKNK